MFLAAKNQTIDQTWDKSLQLVNFDNEQDLIMSQLDYNMSAESRQKFKEIIKELQAEIPVSKFIKLVHPCDVFDILAGTSTGAILSFGLVGGNAKNDKDGEPAKHLPMSIEECIFMYQQNAYQIFAGTWSNWIRHKLGVASLIGSNYMYSQRILKKILEQQFGVKTLLCKLTNNKCIAAAVARKIGGGKDELVLFDTFKNNKCTPVVSALLASADAPIYFKTPVKIGDDSYIDGGIEGNCPLHAVFPLAESNFGKVDFVLSVAPPMKVKQAPSSWLSWVQYMANLPTNGEETYEKLKRKKPETHFFRLYPNLQIFSQHRHKAFAKYKRFEEFELNTAEVEEMIGITENWLKCAPPLGYSFMAILPIIIRLFFSQDKERQALTGPNLTGLIMNFGDYIFKKREQLGLVEVREQLQQLSNWIKDIHGETSDLYADITFHIAQCLKDEKNPKEALTYFDQLFKVESPGVSYNKYVARHYQASLCFEQMGSNSEAMHQQEKVLNDDTNREDTPNQFTPVVHRHKASCLYRQRKFLKAMEEFEKSISPQGDHTNYPPLEVARTFNDIGVCLQNLQHFGDANYQHNKALKLLKNMTSEAKVQKEMSRTYNLIGCCKMKDHREALRYFRESLTIAKKISRQTPSEEEAVAIICNNFAKCHYKLGEYREALARYEEALGILQNIHQNNCNSFTATVLHNHGLCLMKLPDYWPQAIEYLEESLNMYRMIFPNEETPEMRTILEKIKQCKQSKQVKLICLYFSSLSFQNTTKLGSVYMDKFIKTSIILISIKLKPVTSCSTHKIDQQETDG